MKLYEIANEAKELQALVDSGDFTPDDIADTLESIDMEFDKKVEACLMVRQSMKAEVAAIDDEIERLKKLRAGPDTAADNLLEYIKHNMLALGRDKLDAGLFKVTLRKPSIQLGAIDEARVPLQFWQTIPASVKLDKKQLLAAAKLNPIDGVELKDSERSLIIR